jgi:predicted Zn-dependent peptidase
MGNLLPPKNSDDYFPMLVLNQVLGGRDISRLFMNLRESKEYAYWAYSSMEFFRTCGILSVRARVRPEVIYQSIREIFREFSRISTQNIALEEIEEAKANLIGNYALSLETQDRMASRISENLSLNLGTAHWNRFYESVMNVSSRRVAEVAGRLPLATPVVIIAGDKDVIVEHLRNFQEVEIYDLKGQFQYKMVKETQNRRP